MDSVYLTILLLTVLLIVLNYIEKRKTREKFENSSSNSTNPETLLSTSAFFKDDGSHRGLLDTMNQLPSPYQHFGNRNQVYDFSVYGDQPFVQCAKCKQLSNCVQYPGTASDKFTNLCTQCNRGPQLGLIREIGYFPPEVQARAIGFTRLCSPSM